MWRCMVIVGAIAGLAVACVDDSGHRDGTTDASPDVTADGAGDVSQPDTGSDAGADACDDGECPPDACEPACPSPASCDESGSTPRCTCPPGYADSSGDGRACQDVDECDDGLDDCGDGAVCVNSLGGFGCDCAIGAIWDGVGCQPVAARRLAAGDQHVCERRPDGSIWCWGYNTLGQLGDGTTERRASPTRAGHSNAWLTVAAGGLAGNGHTCALADDTTLWCWGRTLPSGSTLEPTQFVPEDGWVVIDLGSIHGCGVRDEGTLWCWGQNSVGQMGTPDVANYSASPVQVGPADSWRTVSTGDAHSCGLQVDGSLWCWGINQAGELGVGSTERHDEPVRVGDDTDWVLLEAGAVNTCGIRQDGTLWCWGSNVVGQVGSGEAVSSVDEPTRIGSDGEWRRVEVGGGYTCGIRSDGSLWCWGNLLGFAATTVPTPRRVGTDNDWLEVIISSNGIGLGNLACGLHTDGRLDCWGLNDAGGLGLGFFGDTGAPERVGQDLWRFVEARSYLTYAIRDDGTLWGWGALTDSDGMLSVSQVPLPIGTDSDWASLSASERHYCGLREDGSLWCWGFETRGALGLGEGYYSAAPTQVGSRVWAQVDVGGSLADARSCAVAGDGTLWCWGEGPIGDGTHEDRDRPTQIGQANDWLQVSVGDGICGRRDPGALWCWGDLSSLEVPGQVGLDEDWTFVNAGLRSACGIRSPGTLWCFDRSDPPEQVGSAEDWTLVEELQWATCGLRTDGSLWCWGTDFEGLANGRGGALQQPTRVGDGTDWRDVSVGGLHVCGLRNDDSLWCWGEGQGGRTGHGHAWREKPTEVP